MKKIILILFALFILTACGEKQHTGTLDYSYHCKDGKFQIEVDAPVLIRNVEMVQYYKAEDGSVKEVFANYPIKSFEANGKTYNNPEFPLNSEVFYANLSIGGNALSEGLIYEVVNSDVVEKVLVTDLKEDAGEKYGLILVDNVYVSAGDDWNIGDIKVSFYYLDPTNVYSINAALKSNVLIKTDKFTLSVQ